MYVSSFSTYVTSDSPRKTQSDYPKKSQSTTESFKAELLSKTVNSTDNSLKLPINYISNYKTLNNQQKLQIEPQSSNEVEFAKLQSINSAKSAYDDNSKIFSLLLVPKPALEQTLTVDKRLPQEIQNVQEENLRSSMINTYISNENYYRITA